MAFVILTMSFFTADLYVTGIHFMTKKLHNFSFHISYLKPSFNVAHYGKGDSSVWTQICSVLENFRLTDFTPFMKICRYAPSVKYKTGKGNILRNEK